MFLDKIIFVVIFLELFGYIFYIKNIIIGQTKPNLVSWFIWMLAPFIGVFFQLKAGAGLSVLPVFITGFGSLLIMVAAILTKNALWKITTFDLYCGLLSVLALVFYIFTHNLGISILFAILSDALAFVPTYKKAWKFPESESSSAYSFSILSNIVGLLIIEKYSFTIYSFGVYLIIANALMMIILYRNKIFKLKQDSSLSI